MAVNVAKYRLDNNIFDLLVVRIGIKESTDPSLRTAIILNMIRAMLIGKRISDIFAMLFNPFLAL